MDQGKKTMRHFYCRDVLWDIFEQMANDFDCSIDYLINEAMRYYARSKNYAPAPGPAAPRQGPPAGPGRAPQPQQPPMQPPMQPPQNRRPPPPPAPLGNQPQQFGAPPQQPRGRPQPPPPRPAPPPQQRPMPPQAPPMQQQQPQYGAPPQQQQQQPQYGAPPQQQRLQPAPPQVAGGPTLFLIFNNQRIPVDKEQFIIGRGSKTSDLAIKDGNISRKHAAIIRRNGTFYIKDLGSTNGIDYKGMRIDNKRIDEGDVFHLCDYELRFTYRG